MITVHHLNNSRSQRVLWLLEELGVDYEIKRYDRDPQTLYAPVSLRAVHPLGKSPVITDGDVTLAESGAIIEYIVERYGAGRLVPPPGTPERIRYLYWMHYAEGSAMPALVLKLVFLRIQATPVPMLVRPVVRQLVERVCDTFVDPQLRAHADYMESELARHTWFVGEEFTAADIQMSFPVEAAVLRAGGAGSSRPKLAAYLERIHARTAYKKALERGGPFQVPQ